MAHSHNDMSNWKMDQISYFKRYLEKFDASSKEYTMIKKGIEELESC